MKTDYDLIVIGAGAAGLSVAAGAAQLGVKTALIEKDKLGGDCLYYGCVPSKTFIKSAQVAQVARSSAKFGVKVSDLSVDFSAVINRVQAVIKSVSRHDAKERFRNFGVDVIKGTAKFVDSHHIVVNNKTVSANKFVIATGSFPRLPSIPGLQETGFITNIDVFSLQQQPRSLIVIGAGPIACELAQSFQRLGTEVILLARSRLLSREDEDVSQTLRTVFEKEGIQVVSGVKMIKVAAKEKKKCIYIEQNGKPLQIKAEEILVATGRSLTVHGLDLEAAGVQYSDKGITVDARLRTTQKHIYACGDVIGKYLFTHAAAYEAGIIIRNAVFHLPSKVNYSTFPWVTYTDPEVAHVGASESTLKKERVEFSVLKQELSNVDRAEAEGESHGFTKILHHKGKILGVTIVAPHAGEMLPAVTLAMRTNAGLKGISTMVHPYPTMAEVTKKASDQYFSRLLFSGTAKKWLKRLFRYRGV